jgi:hypothetical protein
MNQSLRTLIYVGVAGVVALLAWASQPGAATTNVKTLVDQPLFPAFTDPLAAQSLEIVQFDEASAELKSFKVAKENGVWAIPSHGNYPADAETQIRDAAGSLTGLEIIGIASEFAKDHSEYGVLEPDKSKLKVGDKGVGTLVALQDTKGNDLVRLIVGKVDGKMPELRYVRKPAEEVIYVSKINLDKLPTEFDKWIEKDLLKINTFDVSQVTLKDYSILPAQTGGFAFAGRMEAAAAWNPEQSNWTLDSLKAYSQNGGIWIDQGLGEQEELNSQKLSDLKTALDDLKIVDVRRKPAGLSESLKSGANILDQRDLMSSLVTFGFLPAEMPGSGKPEIFATNGEVVVDMKDGVQYNLRFGNVSGAETPSTAAKPGEKEEVKLNRYLFVTAQLSPSTLVEPMYEPEPAGPEPAPTDSIKPGEEAKPAAEAQPGEEKKPDDAAKSADPAAAAAGADPKAAERAKIKLENERKRTEYNDKKKKAEARVAELNARFAPWYYVISEDVYKKIHLGRNDIVKEASSASREGFGVDAFRELEEGGINPPPAAPAAGASPPGLPPGLPPGFPGLPM